MNAMQLLTGPFAQAIGWALLHLLWQATIVAAILAAVLALLPREQARLRYAMAIGALALVFAMFAATAARSFDPAAVPIATTADAARESITDLPLSRVPVVIAATAAAGWRDRALGAVASARQSLPTVVALWFLGVVVLSSRLGVSWLRARRLMQRDARPAGVEWQAAAARIAASLGLTRAVRLLESPSIEVPAVIGALRPVILLPASALTGMTMQQLEMVLAHELAHIRRHDFLVNLLQAFVETLMFYHPAVWWISKTIRVEREHCCDDLAVAVCGDRVQYARALARLEELRSSTFAVAVAADGGSLLDRIRRIGGMRAESTSLTPRSVAALATLTILAIALALPSMPLLAQREPERSSNGTIEVVAEEEEGSGTSDENVVYDDSVVEPGEPAEPDEPEEPAEPAEPDEPPTPAAWMSHDFDFDFDFTVPAVAPVAFAGVTPRVPPTPRVAPVARIHGVPVIPATPSVHPFPAVRPAIAPTPPNLPMRLAVLAAMDEDEDREMGASGQLSVDDLISLRAVGVTPEYVKSMRSIFPKARLGGVMELKAVGVTPEFVRDMRSAGMTVESVSQATSLKAVGVAPDYIQSMRNAGMKIASAEDAAGLKAVGVTPAWLQSMKDAGIKAMSADDATSLKAVGVTAEFVRKLEAAGYTNLSVDQLTHMKAAGIDDDFIREMQQYRDQK